MVNANNPHLISSEFGEMLIAYAQQLSTGSTEPPPPAAQQ
jgi:hypothetical protein